MRLITRLNCNEIAAPRLIAAWVSATIAFDLFGKRDHPLVLFTEPFDRQAHPVAGLSKSAAA